MKKIFYLFLSSLLMVSLYSCSSDDDNDGGSENGKVKLTATFTYTHNGETKPSAATEMFIFKIENNESTTEWTYNKANNYYERKDKTVIYPVYSFKANNEGKIEQYIEDKTSYLYVYEAAIDPNVWGADSFKTNGQPIVLTKNHGLTNQ